MKTRILITIGDINGIGPEIIIKTLKNEKFIKRFDITVLSPIKVLEYYAKRLGIKLWADNFNVTPVAEKFADIKTGAITAESGFVSGMAIAEAIRLCMAGEYDAVVTAPISKEALNKGGFNYDGHTEMLTGLSKAKDSCMVMLGKEINMGFASTHPPLKKAAGLINRQLLNSKISICYNTLKYDLGITKPQIGVLALNPHAGDGGLIGNEEIKIINPALKMLRKKYRDLFLSEPYPADSYFANKIYKKFDMTFAMYHDQGFIPFKMIAGLNGVNFTAGLKFVRTSPDHGTAFDIAGKGIANPASLIGAIKAADKIYRKRNSKLEIII
jgi:4-hydroxythreonine-4-phosphate dehydrogenase